jgi:solute carrier family 25 (peroxisomal adenine nucleotide transporter), member 17
LTFAFFQVVHRVVARFSHRPATVLKPGPLEAFFGAATSNCLAVAILYPLILAKTRMQAISPKSTDANGRKSSTLGALYNVLHHAYFDEGRGLPGLYQGLQAQLVKGFINQGVSFLVKERYEYPTLSFITDG